MGFFCCCCFVFFEGGGGGTAGPVVHCSQCRGRLVVFYTGSEDILAVGTAWE